METKTKPTLKISMPAAWLAIGTSALALLALASLHILSPEFDPSFHMVSEYANGHYAWLLSLMFAFWGIGSWALAIAIWQQVTTRAGKIGLWFLIAAGAGEAMASVFDINHPPFHDLAGYIGILGLPIAAMLISVSLSHREGWSDARKVLLWSANLTWVSVVLLIGTFIIMILTYMQSGANIDPNSFVRTLPHGVIGLVGWANRFLVVVYCVWVILVAWETHRLESEK
jgi:hypothetical protein